jgi:hypothetical protein
MRFHTWAGAIAALLLMAPPAHARNPGPATSTGPGRIMCKTAALCDVGIGTPAALKFQIDVADLPAADKDR